MIDPKSIQQAVASRLPAARKFLSDLIAIPSLPGQEQKAMDYCANAFAKLGKVRRIKLSNAIKKDRDFSDPVPGIDYTGRSNLRIVMRAAPKGSGKRLLLSTHVDTVPPSQGQDRAFDPQVKDGAIWGRGACDAKGQVATIYLVMAAVKELGVKLNGDLLGHVVVEEEVGGNGTLAMVRHGEKADGCVILEPTEQRLLTSIRGAVWFRIDLTGKAGHSGMAGKTRSALKLAIRVVEILEDYHARLLTSLRGDPMFDKFPNPMPLTIGNFHAGNWPAAAPGQAFLEGVLGLLPNKTARQIMQEMTDAIKSEGGADIADNFTIKFTYRHDASVLPKDHALVKTVAASAQAMGKPATIDAMTASCDAFFYNNQINIPTLVYGGGSLSVAHAVNEHMPIAELAAAGETLTNLALNWCGAKTD